MEWPGHFGEMGSLYVKFPKTKCCDQYLHPNDFFRMSFSPKVNNNDNHGSM